MSEIRKSNLSKFKTKYNAWNKFNEQNIIKQIGNEIVINNVYCHTIFKTGINSRKLTKQIGINVNEP